jgi:hypothetical protein
VQFFTKYLSHGTSEYDEEQAPTSKDSSLNGSEEEVCHTPGGDFCVQEMHRATGCDGHWLQDL